MAITGSIQQKNGKWYAVLNLKDANGKRKPKWIPTGFKIRGNKKKADNRISPALLDSLKVSSFENFQNLLAMGT